MHGHFKIEAFALNGVRGKSPGYTQLRYPNGIYLFKGIITCGILLKLTISTPAIRQKGQISQIVLVLFIVNLQQVNTSRMIIMFLLDCRNEFGKRFKKHSILVHEGKIWDLNLKVMIDMFLLQV